MTHQGKVAQPDYFDGMRESRRRALIDGARYRELANNAGPAQRYWLDWAEMFERVVKDYDDYFKERGIHV